MHNHVVGPVAETMPRLTKRLQHSSTQDIPLLFNELSVSYHTGAYFLGRWTMCQCMQVLHRCSASACCVLSGMWLHSVFMACLLVGVKIICHCFVLTYSVCSAACWGIAYCKGVVWCLQVLMQLFCCCSVDSSKHNLCTSVVWLRPLSRVLVASVGLARAVLRVALQVGYAWFWYDLSSTSSCYHLVFLRAASTAPSAVQGKWLAGSSGSIITTVVCSLNLLMISCLHSDRLECLWLTGVFTCMYLLGRITKYTLGWL